MFFNEAWLQVPEEGNSTSCAVNRLDDDATLTQVKKQLTLNLLILKDNFIQAGNLLDFFSDTY
jgi:hypothetical protein